MKKDFGALLVSLVLAGFCIGIGITAYFLCETRLMGCIAYSVGLLLYHGIMQKLGGKGGG